MAIFSFSIPFLSYKIFYTQKKMAELFLSTSTFNPQFPSLIYSDFAHLGAFILSHPLHFSYFIFFSPYLLKLLSFLSPLFITTSLLLLLGLVHNHSVPKLSETGPSFLLSTFHVITHWLRPKVEYENQEFHYNLEEFEAYRIVFLFDTSTYDVIELRVGEKCLQDLDDQELVVNLSASFEVKPACEVDQSEGTDLKMEEKSLQDFFNGLDDCEDNVDEKAVDPQSTKWNKVVGEDLEGTTVRKGSEAKDIMSGCDNEGEYTKNIMSHGKSFDQNGIVNNGGKYTLYTENRRSIDSNLGSYGSMRKVKEWKRTLACKLLEERHTVEGDEGIDALWEAYESQDLSKSMRMATDTMKKKSIKKLTKMNYHEDEKEEEELEITNVQLCCLQAFKFSARKMSMGMGRPNLVKFSKAVKGMGWLHQVKRHEKNERF